MSSKRSIVPATAAGEGFTARDKAGRLYAEIDRTGFYRDHVVPDSRSLMNVTFRLPSEDLEKQFG